jgi:hypothetical protein
VTACLPAKPDESPADVKVESLQRGREHGCLRTNGLGQNAESSVENGERWNEPGMITIEESLHKDSVTAVLRFWSQSRERLQGELTGRVLHIDVAMEVFNSHFFANDIGISGGRAVLDERAFALLTYIQDWSNEMSNTTYPEPLAIDAVHTSLCKDYDSYGSLPALLDEADEMLDEEWLVLLARLRSGFDNIGPWRGDLGCPRNGKCV